MMLVALMHSLWRGMCGVRACGVRVRVCPPRGWRGAAGVAYNRSGRGGCRVVTGVLLLQRMQ